MVVSARELVSRVESVVSLPDIFSRIDNLIKSPDSSIVEIANVIAEDPGLSLRLLKIANSAMFNFSAEIDSITRAITVIGTQQLRDLVLATQVIDVFKNVDQNTVDMKSFWQHSIATGIMARIIATFRRETNVEYFYLLGLLHDIGGLVMYMEIPDLMQQAVENSKNNNLSLHQSEVSIIGYDHSTVGAELIAAWNLPLSMHDAICYHHRPSLSLNHYHDAGTVHVADLMINALKIGTSGECDIPQLDEQAWQSLGLSEYLLQDAIDQLDYQYNDTVKLFIVDD